MVQFDNNFFFKFMSKFLLLFSYGDVIHQCCLNITSTIFWGDIARFLQYTNNIFKNFQNILAILPHFNEIFLQYYLNISVLCER